MMMVVALLSRACSRTSSITRPGWRGGEREGGGVRKLVSEILKRTFGIAVEGRRKLVKDHELGLPQERADNADALKKEGGGIG